MLPAMLILGVGMATNPLLLAAMGDVPQEDAGLASGVVNTSLMLGCALGLAVLASVAAARTGDAGTGPRLVEGYHAAFAIGTVVAAAASAIAALFLRGGVPVHEPVPEAHAVGVAAD